jgi:hypothetical protein
MAASAAGSGGGTNKANWHRAVVQTKPIGRRSRRVDVRNKANLPPDGQTEPPPGSIVRNKANFAPHGQAGPPRDQSCETKPISGTGPGGHGAWGPSLDPRPSGLRPFPAPLRSQSCKTKPISRLRIGDNPAAGRLPCGLPPPACGGQKVRKKANSRPSGYPPFHYSIIPPFPSDAHRAKRSQFLPDRQARASGASVRNEPNSAKPAGGPGCRREKMCETNPIWVGSAGTGGTERTKQTQFRQTGRPAGSPESENVQNEPNLRRWRKKSGGDAHPTESCRDRTCETNPIPDGAGRRTEYPKSENVRNKANFAPDEQERTRASHAGELSLRSNAKRSQFLPDRQARSPGGKCAKRSQFRGSGSARANVSTVGERSCNTLFDNLR